jgi:hypothetical protein
MNFFGKADTTLVRGNVVWDGHEIIAKPGSGKFLKRENAGYVYERSDEYEKARDPVQFKVERPDNN